MIFLLISLLIYCIAACLYYLIKGSIYTWKKLHRNKCPFCGAYLHGYQYKYSKAKHMPRYCSRCGKPLNEKENNNDSIKFRKECKALLLCANEYRERMKKFGCEGCEFFGNECDGLSGQCDCAIIKEKK